MKPTHLFLLALVLLHPGCDRKEKQAGPSSPTSGGDVAAGTNQATLSLSDARRGFETQLNRQMKDASPVAQPPPQLFGIVRYRSPVGPLSAYLTQDPRDGAHHPVIIWITGGDCNTIGDVWSPATQDNDQTAAAYREAGILMMFPSLRGGNDNPGFQEKFYGEVDDVLAAADFLTSQSFIDPNRIYLGGHSTGGTLALLVAECSNRFRAVFSFGPVDDVGRYDPGTVSFPFDTRNRREVQLRSPAYWLRSIQTPTFVFEGDRRPSNVSALRTMEKAAPSPSVHFFAVPGVSHFSILAPANQLIARKIVRAHGSTTNLTFTREELAELVAH